MADKSIGDLPKAAALYDNDRMVLEQNGEAKHMEGRLLKDYVEPYASAAQSALEGVKEAIDNIPEGTATPIVNDLTTGGTSMALSAEMGKVLGQRPNPNLLDNWYFGNPVNQRGQTEYTTANFTVDRWEKSANGEIIYVEDGCIKIAATANGYLTQSVENYTEFASKTVTLSALIKSTTGRAEVRIFDGVATSLQYTNRAGLISVTRTLDNNLTKLSVELSAQNGASVEVVAAKLELGTQQTLAHQDADGNWVLNEIPDYNEQLLRCCMSTADSSDTYANNKLTAAAVNAVPLDGSKAMTGDLCIKKDYAQYKQTQISDNSQGFLQTSGHRTAVGIRNVADDTSNTRSVFIDDKVLSPNIANALIFRDVSNGTTTHYNILHTGNKPSGSYTGNGSSAYRSVTLGGIGRLCLITRSGNYWALASARGAIISDGSSVIAVNNTIFDGACNLQLNTSHAALNENGITYTYQVL